MKEQLKRSEVVIMMRVYVDTSVFGGCFDPGFVKSSNNLLEEFKSGSKIIVISDLTLKELEEAPLNVRKASKRQKNSQRPIV